MKRGYWNVYSIRIPFSMPFHRKEVNRMAKRFYITYNRYGDGEKFRYIDEFDTREEAERVARQLEACEHTNVKVRENV